MKTTPVLFCLALIFVGSAVASTEVMHVQMPAQKTGTGGRDYYNVGALVGDDPSLYYICIASPKKLNPADVVATGNAEPLVIGENTAVKGFMTKAQVVMLHPTREQMERASRLGMHLRVTSKAGVIEFAIPELQFVETLVSADKVDRHRRAAQLVEINSSFDAVATQQFLNPGKNVIQGQAFLKTRGGEVRVGAGNIITLRPADAWSSRAWNYTKEGGRLTDLSEPARMFMANSARLTEADATGNFEFRDLPAGTYHLETVITWEVPSRYRGTETTGGAVTKVVKLGEGKTEKIMLTR